MRRETRLDVNFDGLTDSVTNLVGSLVLLVVLVVAVTEPKVEGVRDLPVPERQIGAQQPIDPLLEDIRRIRGEIECLDRDIGHMEVRTRELNAEVDALHSVREQDK